MECTMVERRVLALATRHPFLTHLHSAFQSQVRSSLYLIHVTSLVAHAIFKCIAELVPDEREKSDWFL